MNKQQSLEKIKKLVERYNSLSDEQKKTYNEQPTKDRFIRPLFEALGWDFEKDVWPEEKVSKKRVDYSFRINGITKFFIEAKAIPINLDEERWAEQAMDYSWHKSVSWAILTDFEAIKVFNTEWDEPDIQSCQFIEIKYPDYLTDERLWWLSKEAFEKGVLEKEADKYGRRPKKSIDKQLADDLVTWRDLLYKNLCSYNSNIEKIKIAEYVQRILDRLIFIRTLEDRKIEDIILQPIVRAWQEKKGTKADELLFSLNKIFRKIDSGYNSGLFKEDACDHLGDKLEADDHDFEDIIEELYKTKKGVRYNFADIPADVFGSIYEQYLGHIQKENGGDKKSNKRKSQGIYYTPRYIVNYIVQNTLGEVLKTKTPAEIQKIKILDPACGSGSFLIAAYQTLIDYWQKNQKDKFKGKGDKLEKLEQAFNKNQGEKLISAQEKQRILLNNIYGVDLDEEAVELARLNLLLKMVGRRAKLPNLDHNIEIGNSLIDDPKFSDKAFNWQKQFSEVFKQGGFDVIVGNPPYIFARGGSFSDEEKKYYYDNFPLLQQYQLNTYLLFIELGLKLLKKDGHFGFIVPNNWLTIDTFTSLRRFLLNRTKNLQIVNIHDKVFEDASVDSCLLIFQNGKPDKITLGEFSEGILEILGKFLPTSFQDNNLIINISAMKSEEKMTILNKIKNFSISLKECAEVSTGLKAYQVGKGSPIQTEKIKNSRLFHSNKKENKTFRKYLDGRDVMRYKLKWSGEYLSYGDWLAEPRRSVPFIGPRILVRQIPSPLPYSINAVFVGEDYLNDINSMVIFDFKYIPSFLLAILNSRLVSFWFANTFDKFQRKIFPQFKVKELAQFPIFRIDLSIKKEKAKHDELANLADKMLKLNKSLQKLDPILDDKEYNQIKKEIEETDKIIDQKVYELYGLTGEEIKIIEDN